MPPEIKKFIERRYLEHLKLIHAFKIIAVIWMICPLVIFLFSGLNLDLFIGWGLIGVVIIFFWLISDLKQYLSVKSLETYPLYIAIQKKEIIWVFNYFTSVSAALSWYVVLKSARGESFRVALRSRQEVIEFQDSLFKFLPGIYFSKGRYPREEKLFKKDPADFLNKVRETTEINPERSKEK